MRRVPGVRVSAAHGDITGLIKDMVMTSDRAAEAGNPGGARALGSSSSRGRLSQPDRRVAFPGRGASKPCSLFDAR